MLPSQLEMLPVLVDVARAEFKREFPSVEDADVFWHVKLKFLWISYGRLGAVDDER